MRAAVSVGVSKLEQRSTHCAVWKAAGTPRGVQDSLVKGAGYHKVGGGACGATVAASRKGVGARQPGVATKGFRACSSSASVAANHTLLATSQPCCAGGAAAPMPLTCCPHQWWCSGLPEGSSR